MIMKLRNNNKSQLYIFTGCSRTVWQQPKVSYGSNWEDWAVSARGWWHFAALYVVSSFSDLKIPAVVSQDKKKIIASCTDKDVSSWYLSSMNVTIQVSPCACISVPWIWLKSGPGRYEVVMRNVQMSVDGCAKHRLLREQLIATPRCCWL